MTNVAPNEKPFFGWIVVWSAFTPSLTGDAAFITRATGIALGRFA